ncbi:MAG: hypothetical protein ACYCZY_04340 [Lacisediminihabitans sp.]
MPSRAPLPSWQNAPGDRGRNLAAIDGWAGSAAMAALVEAFGGSVAGRRGRQLLVYLDDFSAAHWDFRGGRERNLAAEVPLPASQERQALASAAALGLAGRYEPQHRSYDTILMTGGMIRAGIVKPRFVRELLDTGLAARKVVFLGGFRPFAGDELELADVFGVAGANESDAMVRGMELTFGPLGDPVVEGSVTESSNASWRSCSWVARGVTLSVLAAPSSEPQRRRANSADTYRFWAEHHRQPDERSVLVVTTPIYVPYQGTGAVEILGLEYGLAVETVGVSASAGDLGEHSQVFLPQHHLQEIRSAIRGMRSLRGKLVTRGPNGSDPHDSE